MTRDSTFVPDPKQTLPREPASAPTAGPATPPGSDPGEEVFLEDFVIDRKLGEGGMGAVFLVYSQATGQHFALKRTTLPGDANRRNFLAELQTWLDLPDYPHLTACRFFRTAGDDVVVFAEYVAGGSLHDWIAGGMLTELEKILDVAIQFAWGLHAAHEAGVVHQDVKPGNVLLTAEGLVKVTDFGLARARGVAGEGPAPPGQSILVSCGGMTPAYCSPEQEAGEPLSRKTDVWSWGVSLLEMFTREVFWRRGPEAPWAMEGYLGEGESEEPSPIPEAVVEVLRRCFREEPDERWSNLEEAAEQLQTVYQKEFGRPYPRRRPPLSASPCKVAEHDRRTIGGAAWQDPRPYLERALKLAGRHPREVGILFPSRGGSRQAQAVAELAIFEEARRVYQRVIDRGRKEQEPQLALVCHHKALVHEFLNDMPGAGAQYDQALTIFERLVHQEGRGEWAHDLAMTYQNKGAGPVHRSGDQRATVVLFDRAIALWERLVNEEGRRDLANDLARTYLNKTVTLRHLGDRQGAVPFYDRAIALRERLVNEEGRRDLAGDLAIVYHHKAMVVGNLGDARGEVNLFDQALTLWERLVHQEGRREFRDDLALGYQNKAATLCDLGDRQGGVALLDRAIAIYEPLVHQEGRRELNVRLATVYSNKGVALGGLGDERGAVALYDQSIAIRERLVNQEGRRDVAQDLARSYLNKAAALERLGDRQAALPLYDKAIAIHERLVNQEGRGDLLADLAKDHLYRAELLLALGNRAEAQVEARAALPVLQGEIDRTGRADLKKVLKWATSKLAEVL